ncbi:DUF4232 domain-containing protein [Actinoplanes siamensis]|uniref:DUF4232 domain-containing protein n=1 Tax=Actinoplanes siamensis TaxID=1223317 RepID=A0A919NF96_9ACTN|nr:DUF4232 domain-containing protein [Actinoplanes siamensis]GIF09796.1 hypothetical protein Asi03nite_73340 [Actinoplanes siamensis]
MTTDMRDIRARVLVAASPALLLLGATAGCSEANHLAAALRPTTTPATAGSTAEDTTDSTAEARAATLTDTGSACRTADLKATITLQPNGTPTNQRAMVTLTNRGKHACTLDGWLSIAPVNAADELVVVPTRKVAQPGPAKTFTVKPGVAAFAGIKWTVCAESDVSCNWANSLRYSLTGTPGDGPYATLEDFPNPERNGIRMKSLQIGTLQPSRQAVLAWLRHG